MKTQAIVIDRNSIDRNSIDRRQHAREGILAQIEDITYRILRKYGIDGSIGQQSSANMAKTAA
jgi:hypothetical protein